MYTYNKQNRVCNKSTKKQRLAKINCKIEKFLIFGEIGFLIYLSSLVEKTIKEKLNIIDINTNRLPNSLNMLV